MAAASVSYGSWYLVSWLAPVGGDAYARVKAAIPSKQRVTVCRVENGLSLAADGYIDIQHNKLISCY